jgi:pilus assembly protein CpaB
MRLLILCLMVLIVAIGAGGYLYLNRAPEPLAPVAEPAPEAPPAPVKVEVFAPTNPIAAGTILTEAILKRFAVEPGMVSSELVVADEDGRTFLEGAVARQSLPEGVPIARSAIIHPGDRGFLAAVLPRGMRAISIEITEVAGLSGLVLPGDHVDIILTYVITAEQGDFERDIRASETVIRNVRVLALDQRVQAIRQEFDKDGIPLPPPIASTATLEVMPRQAEMVSLAASLGTLSLVLNSAQDGGSESLPVTEFDDLLAPILKMHPGEKTEPAALRPARELTMDTDVTTLLARLIEDAAKDNELDAIPRMNRIDMVQVVRGRDTRMIEIGAPQDVAAPEGETPTEGE